LLTVRRQTEQYQDGNFPELHRGASTVGDDDDYVLVQWCHGAPGTPPFIPRRCGVRARRPSRGRAGMVLPLLQGFAEFKNQSYLQAAEKALDAIWKRGLLTKGMMLCHGVWCVL
jgi:hypothetical protein